MMQALQKKMPEEEEEFKVLCTRFLREFTISAKLLLSLPSSSFTVSFLTSTCKLPLATFSAALEISWRGLRMLLVSSRANVNPKTMLIMMVQVISDSDMVRAF